MIWRTRAYKDVKKGTDLLKEVGSNGCLKTNKLSLGKTTFRFNIEDTILNTGSHLGPIRHKFDFSER